MNTSIAVRDLGKNDCPIIADAFKAQGWNKPLDLYLRYFEEWLAGQRVALIAEYAGEFAGYVTILWQSDYPPFRAAAIPEISDFNVLIKFRRQNVGTALMDEAEKRIALRARFAGLGVCLDPEYGPAQVLYARRGYVPDGRGIFQHDHHPKWGEQVTLDDALCLYLTKPLF